MLRSMYRFDLSNSRKVYLFSRPLLFADAFGHSEYSYPLTSSSGFLLTPQIIQSQTCTLQFPNFAAHSILCIGKYNCSFSLFHFLSPQFLFYCIRSFPNILKQPFTSIPEHTLVLQSMP